MLGRFFRKWTTCRVGNHAFVSFDDGLKRKCSCCGREEWLFSKPYPAVGDPKYSWREMPFDRLKF